MQITVLIMMGLIPQEGTVQYSDSKTEKPMTRTMMMMIKTPRSPIKTE